MKLKKYFLETLIIAIILSCKSQTSLEKSNLDSSEVSININNDNASISKFLGTWVSHSKRHFQIVEIKDSSNATVYLFDHWSPIFDTTKRENYGYYKSDGKVSISYQANLLIKTNKFKFIYLLSNDTLFQMAEPGQVDTLLKVYSDSTQER